jgi:hypothetical protein
VSCLILCTIFWIPLSTMLVCAIVALGKRPGYRRRVTNTVYTGEERRCEFKDKCLISTPCVDEANCKYFVIAVQRTVNTETDKDQQCLF